MTDFLTCGTGVWQMAQTAQNRRFKAILDKMPIKGTNIENLKKEIAEASAKTGKAIIETAIKETKMTDFTKPVQTRSGLPVKILTVAGRDKQCVIGHIGDSKSYYFWTKDGLSRLTGTESENDLINAPEKRVAYIYFYRSSNQSIFALSHECSAELIAKRRVEYTEGQFDE